MPKKILLGITGSIAAYKIPDLIRSLISAKYSVTPILSKKAEDFVTPTTITTVSGTEAITENSAKTAKIKHLEISKNADIFVIAAASANTIAKLAHGLADSLLTSSFLSFTGPKLIVPAMHTEMYENSITQKNIETLKTHGVHILGPIKGELACQDHGMGRMIANNFIKLKIDSLFLNPFTTAHQKILITAGGTEESIDSVRSISNAASGSLGHTIASIAAFKGASVTLISSKPYTDGPTNINHIQIKSVDDMHNAVIAALPEHDVLYMTAAVSDFKIAKKNKDKKLKRQETVSLELEGSTDILKAVSKIKTEKQTIIGFCLEEKSKLSESAKEKCHSKNLDYIIANTPDNIGKKTRTFDIYTKKGLLKSVEELSLIESASELLQLKKGEN